MAQIALDYSAAQINAAIKKISELVVTTDEIKDNAITSTKIADGAVGEVKLSPTVLNRLGNLNITIISYRDAEVKTALNTYFNNTTKGALYIKLSNGLLVPANTNGETISGIYAYGSDLRKVLFDGTNWSDAEIQNNIIDTDHIKDSAVTLSKLNNDVKTEIEGAVRWDKEQSITNEGKEQVAKNIAFRDKNNNFFTDLKSYIAINSGNNLVSNSFFGINCIYNNFGEFCLGIIFGNNCSYNTLGEHCSFITFGNNCNSNTIDSSCQYLYLGNGVSYIKIENKNKRHYLQNIYILSGVRGESSSKPLIIDLSDEKYFNKSRTLIISTKRIGDQISTPDDLVMYYADEVLHGLITTDKLKDNSVTHDKLVNNAVSREKLSTDVQDSLSKADTALQSIADKSITKEKLDDSVQTSLGKADNSLQIGETNTQSKQTVITTESTGSWGNGLKVQNSSNGTEITPTGITFGLNTQPIGIYKNDLYELKLNSAIGSGITLSGIATPTKDTDAANKKYVDDGFVKLGKTNTSTSVTTFAANTGQALNIQASDTMTYLNGTSISVGTRSSETAASLTKTALVFGKQATNYGSIQVNSNNKLQITGLDTPTSNTDAANKKYVDDKIVSEIYDRVADYQTEFSDDLETTAYNVVPAINEVNTLAKAAVSKTNLATSLQAITIYTDNTAANKAANLANIKAYEDSLKALGFTTTKDHNIPINIYDTTQKGFIGGNTSANRYHGIMGADNNWQMFVVTPDGTFTSNPVLGGYISQLDTTNKTSVIAAINEVNTKLGDIDTVLTNIIG